MFFLKRRQKQELPADADYKARRAAERHERKPKLFLALMAGVGAHLVIFLFGGMLVPKHAAPEEAKKVVVENVQLDQQKDEQKNEEKPQDEPPPPSETEEQVQNLSQAAAAQDAAPAMANLSLSDLSSALGGGGDGMGASAAGLGGVGFAGGTGTPGGSLGGGGSMVSSADLDNKPTVTTRVNPKPVKGVAGKVKLLLVVGPDGAVSDVKPLEADHPELLKNCVSAVRQWRFKPGTRGGKAVPFKMQQPFSFQG